MCYELRSKLKNISSTPLVCLNWLPACFGISNSYKMIDPHIWDNQSLERKQESVVNDAREEDGKETMQDYFKNIFFIVTTMGSH